MNAEIFVVCISAIDHRNGKLSVREVYNRIPAPSFPAIAEEFTIALRLRFEKHEFGNHRLAIKLSNSTGQNPNTLVEHDLSVQPEPDSEYAWISGVIGRSDLLLTAAGEYHLLLSVDGQPVATYILNAVQVSP